MLRHHAILSKGCKRLMVGCSAGAIALFIAQHAFAVGLTYVDGNANPFAGGVNLAGDTFNLGTAAGDGHWDLRNFGAGNTVYDSGGTASEVTCAGCTAEGAPEITQTITGLNPGSQYNTYAVFWSADGQNWMQRAGVATGVNTIYDRLGPVTVAPTAVAATYASAAVWDVLPPLPTRPNATQFHEDDRSMLLGFAGVVTADGSGNAVVYLNDLPAAGNNRSFFDGVAYAPVGTPIALTASINRATGALVINNPTSSPFQIKAYSVASAAGSLNATAGRWNSISGHTDGAGNGSFDTDIWNITAPANPATTPFAAQMAEAENASGNGSGGMLASGGAINLGTPWQRTPYEDVLITLTLTDNSSAVLNPSYTGTAIATGDIDANGSINLGDFQTLLTNLHTNVSVLTKAEAYTRGDLNGDRLIDFNDFQAFRTIYSAAHGAGAFEQLVASVPEPSSLFLVSIAAGLATARRRRSHSGFINLPTHMNHHLRTLTAFIALTSVCNLALGVPVLRVDINDRTVTDTPNTVTGFNPWVLTGTTAAISTPVTQSVAGTGGSYSVTLAAWDDGTDGNPSGAIDDRDRALPADGGSLSYAQIYDDFVFAGASVGPSGGIDLTVSGGGLLPNTNYTVSLYSYDGEANSTAATRRIATWRDRNNADNFVLKTDWIDDTPPTTNDTYKFNGIARTDGLGKLWLRGRGDPADSSQTPAINGGPPVYINGFEVEQAGPVVDLTLEVNTTSGAVRLLNEQSGINFDVSYYEIRSAAARLNPGNWSSFDDAEAGDPVGTGWDEAGGSSSSILSEVNLTSLRTFAPGNSASLGSPFLGGGAQDLLFLYAGPNDSGLKQGIVKYVTGPAGVLGDYNGNGVVDAADYVVWRNGGPLQNEGASTGVVDQADYAFWRSHFGNTAGSGSLLPGTAIPEPAAASLLLLMTLRFAGCRRERR